jgi:hypothetical protein
MKASPFILVALITSLTWLWMPAVAFAADHKVYPGSACVPNSPSSAAPSISYLGGFIMNTSSDGSSSITVNCLIVRDHTTNTDGLRNVSVRVLIPSRAAATVRTARLGCTLISWNGFSGIGEGTSVRRPYSEIYVNDEDFDQQQSLEFSGEQRLKASFSLGQYALRCDLPAGSFIYS